jgi:hypothetical protein
MGLFDLPAPLLSGMDALLALAMPPVLRLVVWGVLSGWLSMVVYRHFSNQQKIGALKKRQKDQQREISEFDGEFSELLPLIRKTLVLGFRQLGHALGPALLASVPVLFIVIWVAGEYGHDKPAVGSEVFLSFEPADNAIQWSSAVEIKEDDLSSNGAGWVVRWPSKEQPITISDGSLTLLVLPLEKAIPVIHKQRWWNFLIANPLGYLPQEGPVDSVDIDLPKTVIIGSGPAWVRGWMFSFFMAVLLSSLGFKHVLRID